MAPTGPASASKHLATMQTVSPHPLPCARCPMAHPIAPAGQDLPAASVWTHLTAERRADVLRLLAQLAYAFIITPLRNSSEETNRAAPFRPRQDSPRTP